VGDNPYAHPEANLSIRLLLAVGLDRRTKMDPIRFVLEFSGITLFLYICLGFGLATLAIAIFLKSQPRILWATMTLLVSIVFAIWMFFPVAKEELLMDVRGIVEKLPIFLFFFLIWCVLIKIANKKART